MEASDRHTTEPPKPAPIATTRTEATGERRHVTVMFCDLVDSTGIAAKLDAEEWRDLVGAYIGAGSAVVVELGGKVAKKLGDGLMALFQPHKAHCFLMCIKALSE
jgi:class 3 adenylate cyclase